MASQAFFTPALSRSDQARLRLLEAGVAVFGEKGLKGATVREIARAAGQNVAAIAYYFGGKEKLYEAVLEGIVRELRFRLREVLDQLERMRQDPRRSPEEARRILKEFLRVVYLRLLSLNEAVPIVRLVVREMLAPTAGFELLYEKGFKELHEGLCWLVGTALRCRPEDRQTILRTHMLMGQVYFFAMSREAILRRLGWADLEGRNAELVTKLLEENLERLLPL